MFCGVAQDHTWLSKGTLDVLVPRFRKRCNLPLKGGKLHRLFHSSVPEESVNAGGAARRQRAPSCADFSSINAQYYSDTKLSGLVQDYLPIHDPNLWVGEVQLLLIHVLVRACSGLS